MFISNEGRTNLKTPLYKFNYDELITQNRMTRMFTKLYLNRSRNFVGAGLVFK